MRAGSGDPSINPNLVIEIVGYYAIFVNPTRFLTKLGPNGSGPVRVRRPNRVLYSLNKNNGNGGRFHSMAINWLKPVRRNRKFKHGVVHVWIYVNISFSSKLMVSPNPKQVTYEHRTFVTQVTICDQWVLFSICGLIRLHPVCHILKAIDKNFV